MIRISNNKKASLKLLFVCLSNYRFQGQDCTFTHENNWLMKTGKGVACSPFASCVHWLSVCWFHVNNRCTSCHPRCSRPLKPVISMLLRIFPSMSAAGPACHLFWLRIVPPAPCADCARLVTGAEMWPFWEKSSANSPNLSKQPAPSPSSQHNAPLISPEWKSPQPWSNLIFATCTQ